MVIENLLKPFCPPTVKTYSWTNGLTDNLTQCSCVLEHHLGDVNLPFRL